MSLYDTTVFTLSKGGDRLWDEQDVLRPGAVIYRQSFQEGTVKVVDVARDRQLVMLRHYGYSSWINRSSGLGYTPARIGVYPYSLEAHGNQQFVTMHEDILEAPIRDGLRWKYAREQHEK